MLDVYIGHRHGANTVQTYLNTNTLSLGEYEYSKLKCIRIRILSKVFANTFLNTFPGKQCFRKQKSDTTILKIILVKPVKKVTKVVFVSVKKETVTKVVFCFCSNVGKLQLSALLE